MICLTGEHDYVYLRRDEEYTALGRGGYMVYDVFYCKKCLDYVRKLVSDPNGIRVS